MLSEQERSRNWLQELKHHGYRLTSPRKAVVEVVANSASVLSPHEIYALGRGRYAKLGLVTVYRTLEKLEEMGLVQRVHRPDGCEAFIAGVDGHQHLLVCESCGRVEYFGGDKLDGLINKVQGDSGYEIREHWLQFFGLCQACQLNN